MQTQTEKLLEVIENNHLLGSENKAALLSLLQQKKEEERSDEEAAEKAWQADSGNTSVNPLFSIGFDAGCAHVRSQDTPEIKALDGWISVKDRLPEERIRVLTWDGLSVQDCYIHFNNEWKYTDGAFPEIHLQYITHWMPLPKPPVKDFSAASGSFGLDANGHSKYDL